MLTPSEMEAARLLIAWMVPLWHVHWLVDRRDRGAPYYTMMCMNKMLYVVANIMIWRHFWQQHQYCYLPIAPLAIFAGHAWCEQRLRRYKRTRRGHRRLSGIGLAYIVILFLLIIKFLCIMRYTISLPTMFYIYRETRQFFLKSRPVVARVYERKRHLN